MKKRFFIALELVLELSLVDQTGAELTEILALHLLSAGVEGMSHHHLASNLMF